MGCLRREKSRSSSSMPIGWFCPRATPLPVTSGSRGAVAPGAVLLLCGCACAVGFAPGGRLGSGDAAHDVNFRSSQGQPSPGTRRGIAPRNADLSARRVFGTQHLPCAVGALCSSARLQTIESQIMMWRDVVQCSGPPVNPYWAWSIRGNAAVRLAHPSAAVPTNQETKPRGIGLATPAFITKRRSNNTDGFDVTVAATTRPGLHRAAMRIRGG